MSATDVVIAAQTAEIERLRAELMKLSERLQAPVDLGWLNLAMPIPVEHRSFTLYSGAKKIENLYRGGLWGDGTLAFVPIDRPTR